MNSEANILVESERQISALSITICTVILRPPELSIMPSKHETMNMITLDIQQSLVIHFLCIYDIRGSLSEWEQKKESGNIIWNMKNVFTSEYNSILFRSLHNNQEYPVVQRIDLIRNYVDADIINFIDASYVKTENTAILEWLYSILEVISIIEPKYANLY